jgi:hypothetical protein
MTTMRNDPGKPGRLMCLREWLTIPEASRYLALVFGEDVSEADVLRLGLDRQLKLSVRFVNSAHAKRHRDQTQAEVEAFVESSVRLAKEVLAAMDSGLPPPASEKRVPTPTEEQDTQIVDLRESVCDLPMIGAARLDVEHAYQRLTGGPAVTTVTLDGPYVDAADGTRFDLVETVETLRKELANADDGAGFDPVETLQKAYENPDDSCLPNPLWLPVMRLPEDAVLVVRTAALREFETRVLAASAPPASNSIERPLAERERATLLTVIAALAKHAKIDVSKCSKAGQAIEAMTTDIDTKVPARTIEEHLKRIPDALERRGKTSA